jgi:hypothetical protein
MQFALPRWRLVVGPTRRRMIAAYSGPTTMAPTIRIWE